MKTYDTEQRRTLVRILETNTDRQFSALELARLCEREKPELKINTSTVYRLLARLVDEGKAERTASPDGHRLLYRYIDACECAEHIHLKCKKCGQILHLEDEEAEKNLVKAMEKCNFTVDEAQSLIVGVCGKCTDVKIG
ncbi:MAG: transcriptional repressor [Clostridia bacterium]|nr:transcriptional repressor [Clostridia bacterium]